MPPGMLRLNARPSDNPNDHITFIKPLPSPQNEAIARDYLCRIAAKIHPIMRDHGMGVMSLDEFPPNKEFWGRNWNAGENIELVLLSHSQSWLPFQHVQNVMLHELAHIKHMNHGPKFWAFLKQLQNEMRELEAKGWEGAGFYGRGNSLSGEVVQGRRELLAAEIPENLCGGTWTRKKRRSTKPRKPRKRKFAGDGAKLGADESKRSRLEKGKKVAAKPRVAQSIRGRKLRAAAAERRIVIAKLKADMADETLIKAKEEENRRLTALGEKELQGNDDTTDDTGSGVGSDTEDEDPTEDEGEEVVEVKPEPEDEWGLDAMKREMEEMCGTCGGQPPSSSTIRAAS
ncbi:WLM-domain-containing protein, partial [Saitoella complicata NRRL Y-17804]